MKIDRHLALLAMGFAAEIARALNGSTLEEISGALKPKPKRRPKPRKRK